MKVLFFGTAEFACPSLEILLSSSHEVVGVVTQPDRPRGRGQKVIPPPVKSLFLTRNRPIFQPENLRDPSSLEVLKSFLPDIMVIVAYGQILSPAVLSVPPLGCINVHASLLPKYRGAAPVVRAILKGEIKTGVTTMLLDSGMDTGPILLQEETGISPEDTAGTLHDRLSRRGARLLEQTLTGLEKGAVTPYPQDHSQASYASKISKEEAKIKWDTPSKTLFNHLRAFDPWPGANTLWGKRSLKLFRPFPLGKTAEEVMEAPGTIMEASVKGLRIATSQGSIRVRELQLENRPRMCVAEFLKGNPLKAGMLLGA